MHQIKINSYFIAGIRAGVAFKCKSHISRRSQGLWGSLATVQGLTENMKHEICFPNRNRLLCPEKAISNSPHAFVPDSQFGNISIAVVLFFFTLSIIGGSVWERPFFCYSEQLVVCYLNFFVDVVVVADFIFPCFLRSVKFDHIEGFKTSRQRNIAEYQQDGLPLHIFGKC